LILRDLLVWEINCRLFGGFPNIFYPFLESLSEKTVQNQKKKNLNGRGSAKILHTNTAGSLGGLMDKHTRDRPLPVLVLEIQASLSVNPVGAISTPKFNQVS